MKNESGYSRRQLLHLAAVILLSPALRIFPGQTAALAGRSCYLTALAALPFLLLYMFFFSRLMYMRREGEGLAELIRRVLPPRVGRLTLALLGLWLLLYAAFALRAGAQRLIVTIYPAASGALFIIVTGLLAIIASLCAVKSVVRVGSLVLPPILFVLLLILLTALPDIEPALLFPITKSSIVPTLRASLVTVDILTGAVFAVSFFASECETKRGSFRALSAFTAALCLLLTLLSAAVAGSFGAELTARLSQPFFVLVRNLVFFRSVERIEALVVMLWVFPDFLLASCFLRAGQNCLRLCAGDSAVTGSVPRTQYALCFLTGSAVIAAAMLIAPDAQSLGYWSETLVPAVNLALTLVLLPIVYAKGMRNEK